MRSATSEKTALSETLMGAGSPDHYMAAWKDWPLLAHLLKGHFATTRSKLPLLHTISAR